MGTFLGIVETVGIVVSLALILLAAVLAKVPLRHPRWLLLKKLAMAGIAGLISGLIVAFIAQLVLTFILTYVISHLTHDGYASCLSTISNNICTSSFWDSLSFDIYAFGALVGAGISMARYELRRRAARALTLPPTLATQPSMSASQSHASGKLSQYE